MSQNEDLLSKLKEVPKEKLAAVWCMLNSWEFPPELGTKPDGWDDRSRQEQTHNLIRPLMEYIRMEVGMKSCLREWNKDRMTDEQFETFWQNNWRIL